MMDDDELKKILIPIVRQILPMNIAEELSKVQPMTGLTGHIFSMSAKYAKPFYVVEDATASHRPGQDWYVLHVNDEIKEWLAETFVDQKDYLHIIYYDRNNYIEVSEEVYAIVKLKWS